MTYDDLSDPWPSSPSPARPPRARRRASGRRAEAPRPPLSLVGDDDRHEPPARMTVRSPADALALVPVVLGFHPEDSVVLVTFGGDGFHARVDLPHDGAGRDEVVALLTQALTSNPCEVVMVLMFTDDEQAALAVADALVPALVGVLGLGVADVVRADGDRWWSVTGAGETGPGTPYDTSTHPFTADSVFRGQVVRGSRQELADGLIADDPDLVDQVARAAEALDAPEHLVGPGRSRTAWWLRTTIESWVAAGRAGAAAEIAQVLVLVEDAGLRDVVWGALDRSTASSHLEVWTQVLRASPHEWSAGPAALVAVCAWLDGDGALAWTAVERAWEAEPGHSLAQLVADALDLAVPPSTWRPWPVADLMARHG